MNYEEKTDMREILTNPSLTDDLHWIAFEPKTQNDPRVDTHPLEVRVSPKSQKNANVWGINSISQNRQPEAQRLTCQQFRKKAYIF